MANVMMQLMLDIRQLQSALQQATASMQAATTRMGRQVNRAGREMASASKKATGFGNAIDFIKKRVIGAGLFFAGFYQGLILFRQFVGEVVGEFFNLDDALRRVQSITKESDESIGRLRVELLALAKAGALFDQTASDVADSMFTIAQAGFSTADSLVLAKLAAEGAAVGFTSAEVSAKVLVNVLKAYDLPVSKAREVMDIMFQTVDTGIVTFEDLSNNLGRVLASASALEVPLTDITGTVATLTLRGFTAAQAMTSVNRILQTFIRPSGRAREAAEALGIELNRDTIAAEGLVPMLNKMWIAAQQDANVFAEMFDRIQSTRGALSLMSDDGVLLTRVMEDMGISTAGAGAMAKALEERAKSLKFQMSILRSQFLAVATAGLTPLTSSIAAVVQQLNSILAGQNAFFNFFADLKSLVLAVAAAFLFMKRVAITAMFASIASGLTGFVTVMRVSVAEVGLLGTALRGLSGLLTRLAPLLIFLAVFALAKFAGQFDPIAKASKRAQQRIDEFSESLRRNKDLLEEGIITPEQFNVQALQAAVGTATAIIAEDFTPAMDTAMGHFSSFGNAVAAIGGGVRRVFTGDFRDAAQVVRDDFNRALEEMTSNLRDAGATSADIRGLSTEMFVLSQAAEDSTMRELFTQAGVQLREMANATREQEKDLIAAAKAGEGLTEVFGETLITAKQIKEGIEKWVAPIKEAKALTEEILGLTTQQDIVLRALIEPLEDKIAMRNERIAVLKREQFNIAEDIGRSLDDIEEGESAILDANNAQIAALEEATEKNEATIAVMETQLATQKELNETQAAANILADLQNDKLDELTGTLLPAQLRQLETVVTKYLPDGVQGIKDWVADTEAMGQTLDEDVMNALIRIVETLEDNTLLIDVSRALADLGLVQAAIPTFQQLRVRFPDVAPGILRGELGQFQHGVRNFVGGFARVGEAGEELVRLPRGVDVIPNNNIGQALRGQRSQAAPLSASAEVNITTSLLKDFQALKEAILKAVAEQLDDAAGRVGMAKPRFGTLGAGVPRI